MSIQLIYSNFVLLTLKLEVLEYQKLSTIEYNNIIKIVNK